MSVIAHNHDFSAARGGYQCQMCSAFVPDSRMTPEAAATVAGPVNAAVQIVWYDVMSGA